MARKKCPKCRRDTWNEKYGQCSACGEARNNVAAGSNIVAPLGNDVMPGEVCPKCGEKKPSEAALKMRKWRKKRNG